jgi:hypothetical protein
MRTDKAVPLCELHCTATATTYRQVQVLNPGTRVEEIMPVLLNKKE